MVRPKSEGEVFDFTTSRIFQRETDPIRQAAHRGEIGFEAGHGFNRAKECGVTPKEVMDIIKKGKPVEKDLPGNSQGRQVGIAFEDEIPDGKIIRVKISWFAGRYTIVTVNRVG